MALYPPFYPPAYPSTDPPPPPVPEELAVNGVSLSSYCYMTTDVSSLLTVPARRGEDTVIAGRHGRVRAPGKPFDANEIVLPMWIVGARPDGTIPSGGMAREFYTRRDELLNLFYADDVELAFTRPDGSVRVTAAEVVGEPMDFTRRFADPLAKVSVALTLPDAFWTEATEVSQTITGVTSAVPHALTVFAGSTAPIADARVTFFGPVSNPRVAIGERSLQFNGVIPAGRELVLDVGTWTPSPGAGAAWEPDVTQIYREPGPAWLEIPKHTDPLEVVFTHTGGTSSSVEFAGHRKFLSP